MPPRSNTDVSKLEARQDEMEANLNAIALRLNDVESRVTALETVAPPPPTQTSRPYSPDAAWNIPVAQINRHPSRENELCDKLWNAKDPDRAQRNFNINNTSYTYPVYEVTEGLLEYPVRSTTGWGNLDGTTIPFNPEWQAASGTDAQIIILDPATGREWNLWQVSFDGETIEVSNGNLVPGSYWTKEDGFAPSRGCGIQYLAMLVRPWEIEQGVIEHALSMPVPPTSGLEYFAPATKIEYPNHPDGIPEGARFSLDVSDAEIEAHLNELPISDATRSSLRIILIAMRDYGWFITDTSGGVHLQLESVLTADWEPYGLVGYAAGGKEYPRDALDGLITRDRLRAYVPSDQY